MPELTNTEFAAHLRVAAKMIDCEYNYGNPIVPGIVRSMRKAADIIDADEAAMTALQSENVEKDREIERLRLQRPVQVDGDVMALALELAETKAALSTVETERDVHMAVVAEKDEEIEKLLMQVKVKDACISGKSSIITHMETERDAAVELLRRLPESCCGCKYAVDGEVCQCSECDDADTENCTEACPWWCDPCGLCDDKDSWSFCGAQGEV